MNKLLAVHILTTLICNFKCKYCFVQQRNREMTDYTMKKTMEFLVNPEISNNHLNLEFFGGEPLLTPDLILLGIDYARDLAKKHNMTISAGIVSNMSLLTSKLADEFKIRNVGFLASYDGVNTHDDTRQPGTGEIVRNSIKMALSKGIHCTVAIQAVPGHLHNLYEDIIDLHDIGIKGFAINPVAHGYRPYSEEDWDILDHQFKLITNFISKKKLEKQQFIWGQLDGQLSAIYNVASGNNNWLNHKDWSCGACKGSLAIDVSGYIVPCQQMPIGIGFDKWVLGHVTGSINNDVRSKFLETKFPDCSECGVLKCAPCRTVNYGCNGNEFELAEPACKYQRLLFTHAITTHNYLVEMGFHKGK